MIQLSIPYIYAFVLFLKWLTVDRRKIKGYPNQKLFAYLIMLVSI